MNSIQKLKQNINQVYYFRDYKAESSLFIHRALISFIIIIILINILIIHLYHLQVICHDDYQSRSNENRIRILPIPPSRGIIYDRNGIPLASNRTFYQLEVIPEEVTDLEKILIELRDIVDLTDDEIKHFQKERKRLRLHPFTSIPIKNYLTEVQIARFAVNQYRFSGIEVKGYQQRHYPYNSTLAHILGYVANITNSDIKRLSLESDGKLLKNYLATHAIGKIGIERYYEYILHGITGYEEVEVNSRGKVIRRLHEQPPQAGKDIYLTIDLKLQIEIEKLITASSRAAIVVTDPRNGEILALVSTPSYNPNLFVNGISHKDYQDLLNNPNSPLINRTIQGLYPPASTIKPFIAIAALSERIITADSTFFDPGWWQLPNSEKRYRDWKPLGHGKLNVVRAIIESADTFFYQLSYDMGIDLIANWMQKFGYGHTTGIDLVDERVGVIPTREWKQKRHKKPWYQGDTISVGIGQGYWTTTPIQMVKALMILINNGIVKIPHLLYGTKIDNQILPYKQKDNIQIKDINLEFLELVKQGMYGVSHEINGTARASFINAPYKAAVKSGTAQLFSYERYNANKIAEHLRDHKLMIGFAPYQNPIVSVAIVLENGGSGKQLAVGDIVRSIFDYILLNKEK